VMETQAIGRVVVEAVIENLRDLWDAESGRLAERDVRRVALADALVDTGATTLSLPTRFIEKLGLKKRSEKRVSNSAGDAIASLYDAVRLTVGDRQCTVDVLEVPDYVPVLIGQVPMELLDLVVDQRSRTLTGNPAHGGEHVFEMY